MCRYTVCHNSSHGIITARVLKNLNFMWDVITKWNHGKKKQIVSKHGPNWPFCAFMLRTKLYYNPFYYNRHQNVNKPKSRKARKVYGLIFLPFYQLLFTLFSFLRQYARKKNKTKIKLCYNRLQFVKAAQSNTG